MLYSRLRCFFLQHAEADGAHEASSQTQHFLPVSWPVLSGCAVSERYTCLQSSGFSFCRCESCRTKLRSYRGLLTHLHTCSKVTRSKSKPVEQTPPQLAAVTNPKPTDLHRPRLESVSAPQQLPPQIPNPDGAVRPADPQAHSSPPPLLSSPILPLQETSPLQNIIEARILSKEKAPNMPSCLKMDGPKASADPPEFQVQHQPQTRSPETIHPAPGSAPHSPPGSSAIWKKSPGEFRFTAEQHGSSYTQPSTSAAVVK